jgi:Tol biopolymer transport system component
MEYDRDNQKLKTAQLPIHLRIPAPEPGPDPGPVLVDLHLSPDSRWLVADFNYNMSELIDLSTGDPRVPTEGFEITCWRFFTWAPGDIPRMIASDEEFPEEAVQIVDIDASKAETLVIGNMGDNTTIREVAYSADGKRLASGIVYPASKDYWKYKLAVVGLLDGERRELAEISRGAYFSNFSLKWSPDGNQLIWIAKVYSEGGDYSETQLWKADIRANTARTLSILGRSVQYDHPPVWSPDGSRIAVIKVEGVEQSKEATNNLYLIDPESGAEEQVTHFTDRRLSHLQWLPPGWIAFTLSTRTYGEIWVTNLDGSVQYPVAGPTLPNAPFIWSSK